MASDDDGDGHDPRTKDSVARDPLHETLREKLEAIIPDLVRRTFTAGMGAMASTEDGLRKLSRDLQLPNVAGYLADTADNTKDKVLEIIAREVREFLAQVKLSDEIARLLTTLSFEIKTEVRFIPNSERYTGVEPDVKAAVRIKRAESDSGKPDAGKPDAGKPDGKNESARPDARNEPRARLGRLRRLWRRATDPLDLIPDDDEPTS